MATKRAKKTKARTAHRKSPKRKAARTRKAATTRAKGGPPAKRAKARLTAAARRAAGAPRPRRQGQRFGRNTVGAAMKKMDKLAKTAPEAARRKEEQLMARVHNDNSLMTRMAKTARMAADAVVGTGASLLESVTP